MNVRFLIGTHDLLFVTLDTLRYDVAAHELALGHTPVLASVLPGSGWELRHTSGSFTYAAHQAFFAGFLPARPSLVPEPRLFASRFEGSETIAETTFCYDQPNLVAGLSAAGYRTVCIGGVGFFNQRTALGRVLPGLFDEAHWSPELGVTHPASTALQVALACDRLAAIPAQQRVFLFLNVSAIHQPNRMYLPGAERDSLESHAAALRYVDAALAPLFEACRRRAPTLAILCSDHGTLYGEDGHTGHRIAHPSVWQVPYAELVLEQIA
jgi:Sulfatase